MKHDKKIIKVSPNWLDRLRAKKGIPTGSSPDLGTFLLSQANSNPQIPHFPENSQNLPLRRRPRKQARPTKRVLGFPHPSTSSTSTVVDPVAAVDHIPPIAPAALVAPVDLVAHAEGDHQEEGDPPVPVVENPPPRFRVNMIQAIFRPRQEEEEEEEEEEDFNDEEEESNITDLDGFNSARVEYHQNQLDEESDSSVGDDDNSDTSGASVIVG
ncbi:PREDICTED: proline-, glutamic acid- and leucine-rich protein 1-like [Lupinus angustifolius]|nr:PREDICTED: proline-, glutamic acid- and leucine-rich protein 1-like [Lupinus angustifolius]